MQAQIAAKHEVESLLHRLPDECTLEDIQYHLYILEKVRRGLSRGEGEGRLSQAAAEAQLQRWLTE